MQDDHITPMPADAVAVIGAGPAGLAAAAWLSRHGLAPVLFEASDAVGGQWNASAPTSATWPGMRTNTSRVLTAFSDLDHPDGTPTYPTREAMHGYLARYAEATGVARRIRFRTRVARLERAEAGWLVVSATDGAERRDVFPRVVVATGRHTHPRVPAIPGLRTFSGALGVAHTAAYDGPARYRGATVVVAGCSISALEIASEIALNGGRVVTAQRRQRYVLPKLIGGVPTDHVMFNRAAALAGERLPPEAVAGGLKAAVLRAAGSPAQYGADAPADNIFAAGITQSQHYLPAVADGRITVRPWIETVEGRTIRFLDGRTTDADALLLGTGYGPSLPFLAPDLAGTLGAASGDLDLADHTFHPDLPGLAFVGLYDLVGPYFPVLELQARWVAYTFAGVIPAPTPADLEAALERGRTLRSMGPPPMHALAVLFARRAGVEPDPAAWPDLERSLLFGPLAPASFRLDGPDRLPYAAERTALAAASFGRDGSNAYTAEEASLRDLVLASPRPGAPEAIRRAG
ncbi:flavin-containing monooxygenase [Chthonobacter rhizosphaerae]|uniref:flavin-containing monooxygenase n=1 Tax=Chthonobacter rhizosphaerae TaxID=2735553 RepID=UPI0015EE719C|nr:FAD-dependent oxidoreductase [Chthonobacter rhizosphaerae]